MLETTALKILLAVAAQDKETSTVQLAEETGISQQSVSRVLAELDKEGLVKKRQLSSGLHLELTGKGRLGLLNLLGKLNTAVKAAPAKRLTGTLERGLGEGKYYLSHTGYKRPLARLLGKEPFPGTLNLHVKPDERALFLAGMPYTEIDGFTTAQRTYGAVRFYKITMGDRDCGLLLPERTTYGPDKVEIVDTVDLRKTMQLTDGDEVTIENG